MTIIETHRAEDFLKSLNETSTVHFYPMGYVVIMEERLNGSSHIGKTLRIHPGLDTTEDCKKDLEAVAKDFGRKISQ
jgi:hypothetical protein